MLIGLCLLALPVRAQINLLHEFGPVNIQGAHPRGDLISDGTYFYGMVSESGQYNRGTIFRINSDGSGFEVLHAFAGGAADGAGPRGSLIISGTTLYGVTTGGAFSFRCRHVFSREREFCLRRKLDACRQRRC